MKFRRNRQRENVDINLASLIDVVFVLLLFFVVTTTFTRETQLRVELPEAASAEQAPADQGKLVEITISAEGVYSVNNHLLPKSDLATLSEAIERESGGENKLPLAMSGDGKTPHQAVVTAMDAAGKLDPDNPDVDDLKYQLLAEKGEWAKIRDGLQGREQDLDPSSGLGMRYGEALLRLGFAEQARMLFKRATLLLPGNPYSQMMLGEAQLACGDPDEAWETLRPLAMSALARPEILFTAEKAARAAGAPEAEGLRARLDPARAKATAALLSRGDMAVLRQDWPTVLDVYGRFLGQGDDPEVLKRLALGNSGLGRTDQAIQYADRALALAPGSADFQFLAGHVRLQGGKDMATARRLLESAASADPRNPVIARDLRKAKAAPG